MKITPADAVAGWVPARRPPEEIALDGIELRRWRPEDTAALQAAVELSRDHLRAWLPWAAEYGPGEANRYLRDSSRSRTHVDYRIAAAPGLEGDAAQVLGSASLMARLGPGALEIGYWVRADCVGRGIASRAAAALTAAGLALPDVDRVEIHHDVANLASGAIPARLGYAPAGEFDRLPAAPASADAAGTAAGGPAPGRYRCWVLHAG